MTAGPGDWLVVDPSGGERTVTDDRFRASHWHLRDDQWERITALEARTAIEGASVVSTEGRATAGRGDAIVRDTSDNT